MTLIPIIQGVVSTLELKFIGYAYAEAVGGGGAGTTISADLTSLSSGTLQEDDLVLGFAGYGDSSGVGDSISWNTSGYTLVGNLEDTDSESGECQLRYKIMSSSPDTTLSCEVGGNGTAFVIGLVFRGVDTTTPMDVSATTAVNNNSADINPPAITPTTDGAVVVCLGMGVTTNSSGDTITQAGDLDEFYTLAFDSGGVDPMIGWGTYKWTSGAFDPGAWTYTGDDLGSSWMCFTLALRPR